MFKICDGREKFYQWDLDRKLIVEDAAITQVHFCNRTDECSLVCETFVEDGLTLVNVPNILLQTDWKIRVYAYDGTYTKHEKCYEVVSRSKPSDYIYTETEVLNYEHLENEIVKLSEAIVNAENSINDLDCDISTVDGNALTALSLATWAETEIYKKQDCTEIEYVYDTSTTFYFQSNYNKELRLFSAGKGVTNITFYFDSEVYSDDYTSGLSFDSGETPTSVNYTNSGILNWVGTDCSDSDGYSIFKPEPDKHYDIVFYFNGRQFIGLVNGFVPSVGNVVS